MIRKIFKRMFSREENQEEEEKQDYSESKYVTDVLREP